jgi:glycosyltransferase involved in cell wall biosynthesis
VKHTLIVSTFPPSLCGIATYAEEQARFVEKQHVHVIRINLLEQHKRDETFVFSTVLGIRNYLIRLGWIHFEKISLHYADRFFFPWPKDQPPRFHWKNATLRALQSIGLACTGLIAGRGGEIIIHEISTDSRMPTAVRFVRGFTISCFRKMIFHSGVHLDEVTTFYPFLKRRRACIADHHRFMQRNFPGTQAQARAELSIPTFSQSLVLCIGFWNQSKGFEDAIKAFPPSEQSENMLYVVGGAKNDAEGKAYAENLIALGSLKSRVMVLQRDLNDEEFDRWIQAADLVLLPYRTISSSGVAARASLYGKKLILRDLPAFREEYPKAVFFKTEEELSRIFMCQKSCFCSNTGA